MFDSSPPAGETWMEQLSPHLQRNKQVMLCYGWTVTAISSDLKSGASRSEEMSVVLQPNIIVVFQLQDTLLQREEELTRLQEENNKLRGFLNSSFVRNLEEKAKVS